MAIGTLIAPAKEPPVSDVSYRRTKYRCPCGHTPRVLGVGHHRVYFETSNARLDDP
jgi:hypothetical protein